MAKIPGGELANRPLHFIFICDYSGSMAGEKIQSLNAGVREAIPHMQDAAKENPNAQVLVRALKFSNGATWHISNPTPVDQFQWTDLTPDAQTDMGKALSMVAQQMRIPPMTDRALPPVLVLMSDGQPTDDFNKGLKDLMDTRWGQKSVRVAIAIGKDADQNVLQKFIGNPEIKPLEANNPERLVQMIKWVSTEVLKSASRTKSKDRKDPEEKPAGNIEFPKPPDNPAQNAALDVW